MLEEIQVVISAIVFSSKQYAFVLRPPDKSNGRRKSSTSGLFSGQIFVSVKFRNLYSNLGTSTFIRRLLLLFLMVQEKLLPP